MKLIYFILSITCLSGAYRDLTIPEKSLDKWEIRKNSPFLSYSADFFCSKNSNSFGKVVRTGLLCPRYYYDVYDNDGVYQARGITRFLSLGIFYENLMDIDVYAANNSYIGSIEGKFITRSRAKFAFYNADSREIASAYLDAKTSDFLIISSQNELNVLAKLKGNTCGEVGILDLEFSSGKSNIDENMLKIFAAFISDYHESFLEKPKEIHHHHTEYIYQNK